MPDNTLTHLAMLLDRSGSMQAIKAATEQGFDLFLSEQREAPGRCTVTLAQFDNEYEEVYTDLDLRDVPPLELRPRGMTALLDSIGRLVQTTALRIAQLPDEQRPATVIVGIMTDGHENASKEYTHAAIKALVTEREETFGWTFLYMGANQDAIEVGASLGVKRERSLTYEAGNVGQAYAATSRALNDLRGAVHAGAAPAAARDQHAVYSQAERDQAAAPRGSGRGHGTTASPFSEAELVAYLRSVAWSGRPTLGDVATHGGGAVVHATVHGVPVFLNADTSSTALQELVDAAARGPLPWSVIANRAGQLNKVTFRSDRARVPGFYCYTHDVQPTAGRLGVVTAAR
ncbi:hypothetical protein [Cellulosimicrobium marinum]|uniref:hypothetical protein n=1 Tax=Cellulosimicrobium marinum TaxID=1638992 RepID=UPI001E4109B4|nr:hypothetical protein [Cellulosimicrobium marinum]MCB7136048.1 hypothetical protein [Cellulosimicrobium marinum]